jgi:hypothetical protein
MKGEAMTTATAAASNDPEFEPGMATCHNEPRGDYGLEGYLRGDSYPARRYGNYKGQRRYQVQPGSDPESEYWEAMSQAVFKKYFRWSPRRGSSAGAKETGGRITDGRVHGRNKQRSEHRATAI